LDTFQTVVLALIQGLTEFLPISSSAHLILPAQVLGWQDQGLAFDVAVHVGTLLAVMLYFRQDVYHLAKAWICDTFNRTSSDDSRLAWCVLIGTIPAGLAGFLFDDFIEANLRSTLVIAVTTILFGLVLWYADSRCEHRRDLTSFTWKDALFVGLAQALALIPGTSRSGITITAALFAGASRTEAARFSFLLSIPLILAAGGLKTLELVETGTGAAWNEILTGALVSFVSAYVTIALFLKLLERISMLPFVLYRLLLGTVLLLFFV